MFNNITNKNKITKSFYTAIAITILIHILVFLIVIFCQSKQQNKKQTTPEITFFSPKKIEEIKQPALLKG